MLSDNSAYQAYQAVADLNADGRPDRLFATVKRDSGRLYWMPAREGGFDAPQLFATLDWITEGGFVVQEPTVVFGRFYSDVSFTWKWNGASGHLELVGDTPGPES
jgi:hypothetical protein